MKRISQTLVEKYQIEVVDQDTYATFGKVPARRLSESRGLAAIKQAHKRFLQERIEWAKLANNS